MKTKTRIDGDVWEARTKTIMGNFVGFRVFKNGEKVAEQVTALRPEEAINRVIDRYKQINKNA